jgi:hypothetical protein
MRSLHPFWAAAGVAIGLTIIVAGCVGTVEGGPGSGRSFGNGGSGGSDVGTGGSAGGGPVAPAEDRPGRTPLRRLTREQYNNTVRDLLGIGDAPAASFGIDEQDGGFHSNSKAPVKELQIERYLQTAEELAQKAVANPGSLALACAPPRASESACLDAVLRGFGKRAYRRPLTMAESDRYRAIFAAGKGPANDFAGGLTLVVSTMLQSPYFLYRPELGLGAQGQHALTPYEIASRLSYFLQNTMPDDELFAAADANELRTKEQITAQARRLLASAKARDSIVSFYQQWLGLDDLVTVEKDPKAYPMFTPELLAAMKDEVIEFVDQVTRQGDGKLSSLLGAQYSFLRGPLYQLYGVTGSGNTLKKTDLPAAQRAGVMTLAAVMAKHAHADQTSPVGRGYLISDKLLCVVPPPPPDGADNDLPKVDPNVSTRVRFEQHRTKPECASCHALMDPLGIPFEIYDGIGRYRTMDGNRPVDPSSTISGTDRDGDVKDALDLMAKLSGSRQVQACVATQWFRYAFGRGETDDDKATLDAALESFARSEQSIPALMVAITTTGNFRFKKPVSP